MLEGQDTLRGQRSKEKRMAGKTSLADDRYGEDAEGLGGGGAGGWWMKRGGRSSVSVDGFEGGI